MAWGNPGVTIRRLNTFQSPSVVLTANQQRVPFNPLTNIGIARGIRLRIPYTVGGCTTATTLTPPAALQMQQLNLFNRVQIQMAGLTASYDVAGRDLGYLMYCGNGLNMANRFGCATQLGYADVAANTPVFFSFPTSIAPAANTMTAKKYIPILEYTHGSVFNIGTDLYLPLSEYITIPGAASIDASGNIVQSMGDTEIETGLLVMQSAAQSVSVNAVFNGLQGADYNSLMLPGNATYDQLSATVTVNLEHDYYDLPGNAADMPNILQTGMAVTRVARDIPVSAGQVDYYFLRAGLLLRAIMVFYNDATYGQTVDVGADGTATPDKITVILQDGQSTQFINETAADNMYRSYQRYGAPPPGILVHDLLAHGQGTLTECISTPQTTALRESLRGLPAGVTRMHVIEERLVPVQVTTAQ